MQGENRIQTMLSIRGPKKIKGEVSKTKRDGKAS
jgi:hypothetical protein